MTTSLFQIYRYILFQSILIIILSLGFLILQGVYAGISAFVGGMIFIIPTFIFIRIFFKRFKCSASSQKIVKTFYLAETVKLIITILLFTGAMQWSNLEPIPLFGVFVVSQLTYFVLPFLNKKSN